MRGPGRPLPQPVELQRRHQLDLGELRLVGDRRDVALNREIEQAGHGASWSAERCRRGSNPRRSASAKRVGFAGPGATIARHPDVISQAPRAELFEGLPAAYDRMGAALRFGQDPRLRHALVPAIDPRPGQRVLDVALGTGMVAFSLARRGGCEVVGLDESEAMLDGARAHLAAAPEFAGEARFVRGEAERLPFADDEFDALSFTYLCALRRRPGGDDARARPRRGTRRPHRDDRVRSTRLAAVARALAGVDALRPAAARPHRLAGRGGSRSLPGPGSSASTRSSRTCRRCGAPPESGTSARST